MYWQLLLFFHTAKEYYLILKQIDSDFLWSQEGYDQATMALYYQTSFLIVQYLTRRWSWKEMVQLLERLSQGYPLRDALRAQYRTDPVVLEKEWQRWLRRNL